VINKLITDHSLRTDSAVISRPEHEVIFDPVQQDRVQALMRRFEQNPYSPPAVKELQAEAGEEILNALIEMGELIPVSSDVIFRQTDYDLMVAKIRREIEQGGKITLGEVRDLFNTSRKYAQALLEHLDAVGLTLREGDVRKMKQK
jgi:selenocysteine-specific elongation factor